MEPTRVLITGIGLKTGLGIDRESTWKALRDGRHGFEFLPHPTAPGTPPYAGCPIRPSSRAFDLGTRTARQALIDSGWPESRFNPDRVGVVFGLSKGNSSTLSSALESIRLKKFDPSVDESGSLARWLNGWPNAGASSIAAEFDLRGPCLAPVAACATGLIAAIQAADLIRRGVCDVVLAGAADNSLKNLLLGAFRKMGVLANLNEGDDPGRAVRPWDRNRSGFLVGEGAAVLVLEREDHARSRGALPYAEFCGGAFGADAFHETNLNPDPSNLAGLIGRALNNARVDPAEIDHVNVHGTATKSNDPLECQALRLAFGPHADRLACSANKAQIGHLLGAAGAVELAITALSIRDGFVPPTLNLDNPDPLCDLNGTPHIGRSLPIRAALKLSIGFGGHLAAAVLKRVEEPRRAPS